MKKVSIVLTTFKGSNSVEECLYSALTQDYPNLQVVVIDDNGVGTQEQILTEHIVSKYRCYDNLLYHAHEKNRNGSAARNTGIKLADGEYIAFLDDDDILYKNSISDRVSLIEACGCDYGMALSSFRQIVDGKQIAEIITADGEITKDYLLQKYSTPSSIILIKREVIENVGYWDESFNRHQDWEFIIRVSLKYKVCSSRNITVDRIVTWRNNAKNPNLFRDQRLFFLDKMKPIIQSFDRKTRKCIYFIHYYDIGKQYLKSNALFHAIKWFFKAGSLIKLTKKLAGDYKHAKHAEK